VSGIDVRSGQVRVSGVTVKLSNTGKVLFPDDASPRASSPSTTPASPTTCCPTCGITRSPWPASRTASASSGSSRRTRGLLPEWVTSVEVKKQGGTLRHVVCDKAATLLYLANQACIEFHVFLSRVDSLECPDQIVVDFDPESADDFPPPAGVPSGCGTCSKAS